MKTVRRGSRGESVKLLQNRLNENGFNAGAADGIFGKNTEDALTQFQAAHNLDVDGICGPRTWQMLNTGEDLPTPAEVLNERKEDLLELCGSTPGMRCVQEGIKDLGLKEVPNGSNTGPEIGHITDGYNQFWGIDDNVNRPWCAMAVSHWIGRGLDLGDRSDNMDWSKHPFEKFFGGCSQIQRWGSSRGAFHTFTSDTVPTGAIFLQPRAGSGSDSSSSPKAGHTGLIVKDNGDGTVTTIEGNTSNAVKSNVRKKSTLIGYVTWWEGGE